MCRSEGQTGTSAASLESPAAHEHRWCYRKVINQDILIDTYVYTNCFTANLKTFKIVCIESVYFKWGCEKNLELLSLLSY